MKKLATLMAVAALAAFGWASEASATDLGASGAVSCIYSNSVAAGDAGTVSNDTIVVNLGAAVGGADMQAVTIRCALPGKPGKAKLGSVQIGGAATTTTPLTMGAQWNINGPEGLDRHYVHALRERVACSGGRRKQRG